MKTKAKQIYLWSTDKHENKCIYLVIINGWNTWITGYCQLIKTQHINCWLRSTGKNTTHELLVTVNRQKHNTWITGYCQQTKTQQNPKETFACYAQPKTQCTHLLDNINKQEKQKKLSWLTFKQENTSFSPTPRLICNLENRTRS